MHEMLWRVANCPRGARRNRELRLGLGSASEGALFTFTVVCLLGRWAEGLADVPRES